MNHFLGFIKLTMGKSILNLLGKIKREFIEFLITQGSSSLLSQEDGGQIL